MTFKTRLSEIASGLESVLDDILPRAVGGQAVVAEAMRYAALGGGKRLRPFLLIETARLFGREDTGIWQAAHKAYDPAIATLAGDGLLTVSLEVMAGDDVALDPKTGLKIVRAFGQAGGVNGMIGGQVIDISAPELGRTEALITNLQALKTGALIKFACEAGAMLAGASENEILAMGHYASDMGLAFQIKDDILDVEGDAELVGKAVGKDANLGKATFVSILGLEAARDKAAQLGKSAKGHLASFGERGDILCDTVDFVLNRTH